MLKRRRPDTFIVGAPKAGTTSLHRYLQDHPAVYMPRVKEPGYFAPDVPGTHPRHEFSYPDDEEKYLGLFAHAGEERRVGESSTNYLMSPGAPARIRGFADDVRIIAMVRNPVDLVHSLHNQRVSDGAEWIVDFASAIDADDDRRRGKRLPHGLSGFGVAYRDSAMLGEQLERWLGEFGEERVHAVVFDDFAADTATEFTKVLEFLEVDTSFTPASFVVHNVSHRRDRGLLGGMLRKPFVRWLSRKALPSVIGEHNTATLARRVNRRRFTRRINQLEPIPYETRQQLEMEFDADVGRLGRVLGRDLRSLWFAKGPARNGAAA